MSFEFSAVSRQSNDKAVQQALKSGVLNLTNRDLEEFPASVKLHCTVTYCWTDEFRAVDGS